MIKTAFFFFFLEVGYDYGIRDVGSLTQRYMRIEKFIPFWADDLNSNTTPFESGSGYRVKLDVSIQNSKMYGGSTILFTHLT